jgi:hypothetical protein
MKPISRWWKVKQIKPISRLAATVLIKGWKTFPSLKAYSLAKAIAIRKVYLHMFPDTSIQHFLQNKEKLIKWTSNLLITKKWKEEQGKGSHDEQNFLAIFLVERYPRAIFVSPRSLIPRRKVHATKVWCMGIYRT